MSDKLYHPTKDSGSIASKWSSIRLFSKSLHMAFKTASAEDKCNLEATESAISLLSSSVRAKPLFEDSSNMAFLMKTGSK